MSDLSNLLEALGPEPAPAPPLASFFSLLASNVLGRCTTDPAALRERAAELLAAEGWSLVDRTAECLPEDNGRTLLAPPGPKEFIFLARTPATVGRLSRLAMTFPDNHPAGVPYIPVTPAAALIGVGGNLLFTALEGFPPSFADFVREEEAARPSSEFDPGEAFRLVSDLLAAEGRTLVDWTGRAQAGCTLVLPEPGCAFVSRVPGDEAAFERFMWSLMRGKNDGSLQFLPRALVIGRGRHLRVSSLSMIAEHVGRLVESDKKCDPEVVRQKVLRVLREGWRLWDRTGECAPEDTDANRLAPSNEKELVFLAHSPISAPLFSAVASERSELLPGGSTLVACMPVALLQGRTRYMCIYSEHLSRGEIRFLMDDTPERPAPWPPASDSSSGDSAASGRASSASGASVSGDSASGDSGSSDGDSGSSDGCSGSSGSSDGDSDSGGSDSGSSDSGSGSSDCSDCCSCCSGSSGSGDGSAPRGE